MDGQQKIEKDAKALLAQVKKGKSWTSLDGVKHIPLLVDDTIVGNLWKDANLQALKIGVYWITRCCVKIELIDKQEAVGMLWLNEQN